MASHAKKTYKYCEGDEELKNLFIETLRRIAKERIVYVDESGFDDRLDYPYGYCHRSQRFRAQKLGRHDGLHTGRGRPRRYDLFINMFDLDPTLIKSHPNYSELLSYGSLAP